MLQYARNRICFVENVIRMCRICTIYRRNNQDWLNLFGKFYALWCICSFRYICWSYVATQTSIQENQRPPNNHGTYQNKAAIFTSGISNMMSVLLFCSESWTASKCLMRSMGVEAKPPETFRSFLKSTLFEALCSTVSPNLMWMVQVFQMSSMHFSIMLSMSNIDTRTPLVLLRGSRENFLESSRRQSKKDKKDKKLKNTDIILDIIIYVTYGMVWYLLRQDACRLGYKVNKAASISSVNCWHM